MRGLVVLAAVVVLAMPVALVRADGEAGLVVDYGDGRVATYCVAFEGDSIRGDELLARAGLSVNQFSGVVCSIEGVGHEHSGTFASCVASCPPSGDACVYWAYFTKEYEGDWVYSPLGYRTQRSGDGGLQAWKWGEGGPASAPPPAPVSFEQVCGRPPVSVATPTPTAAPATPTPVPATATAEEPTAPATASATAETPSATPATASSIPTTDASPGTETRSPMGTATARLPASTVPPTETPAPPPATDPSATDGDDGGAPVASLAAFGGVAALLLAGIGVAVWRRSHGA